MFTRTGRQGGGTEHGVPVIRCVVKMNWTSTILCWYVTNMTRLSNSTLATQQQRTSAEDVQWDLRVSWGEWCKSSPCWLSSWDAACNSGCVIQWHQARQDVDHVWGTGRSSWVLVHELIQQCVNKTMLDMVLDVLGLIHKRHQHSSICHVGKKNTRWFSKCWSCVICTDKFLASSDLQVASVQGWGEWG